MALELMFPKFALFTTVGIEYNTGNATSYIQLTINRLTCTLLILAYAFLPAVALGMDDLLLPGLRGLPV